MEQPMVVYEWHFDWANNKFFCRNPSTGEWWWHFNDEEVQWDQWTGCFMEGQYCWWNRVTGEWYFAY